jgi:predicted permease
MSAATAGSTAQVRGRRTLWALVAAEFALASLMFVCGGLLVRAYDRVRNTDVGFDGAQVMTFTVNIPSATYPDSAKRTAFWNRLQERVRAIPGVERAGVVSCAPVSGCHWGWLFFAEGAPPRRPDEASPIVLNRAVTPEYFAAMGVRLREGRFFTDREIVDAFDKESSIIVNETFVRTFWPGGGSPIGKRVRNGEKSPWRTVVGVVHDIKHYGLELPVRPGVYIPVPILSGMTVAVRTAGDPAAIGPAARAALREIDPELAAFDMRTMDERLARSRSLRAAYSWMLGVFAVMALLLALGGSYGVTSYLVSQRTRELGIRVALGASGADISRAVMKGSLAVVTLGVFAGVISAIGAGRYLSSLLFGVPPYDALILGIAAAALLLTGALANWMPARRAARVDPMLSLRGD